jgi:hypothetical protein
MGNIDVEEESKLKWPDGWERSRVNTWQKRAAWSKSREQYRKALIDELQRMGAVSVLITKAENERTDPGVAVWFSMEKDARDWQGILGIESPAPTIAEIDNAFVAKAKLNHPDRGGDIAIYQKLVEARAAAKGWVLGTHDKQHDFVMAMDQYNETRLNMAALRLAIANLRSLKRLGMPTILERTLNKAFKAALAPTTGGGN